MGKTQGACLNRDWSTEWWTSLLLCPIGGPNCDLPLCEECLTFWHIIHQPRQFGWVKWQASYVCNRIMHHFVTILKNGHVQKVSR